MAEEDSSNRIKVIFKGGRDFDAPWITIEGETFSEVGLLIEEARTLEVFDTVKAAAAEFTGSPIGMSQAAAEIQRAFPGSQEVQPGVIWAGAQQGQQLPQQHGQTCVHGPMKYIAQGKYGPFWACSLPRGTPGQCKARNA